MKETTEVIIAMLYFVGYIAFGLFVFGKDSMDAFIVGSVFSMGITAYIVENAKSKNKN